MNKVVFAPSDADDQHLRITYHVDDDFFEIADAATVVTVGRHTLEELIATTAYLSYE